MTICNIFSGFAALFAAGFVIGCPMSVDNVTIKSKLLCYGLGAINLYNGVYNLFVV